MLIFGSGIYDFHCIIMKLLLIEELLDNVKERLREEFLLLSTMVNIYQNVFLAKK